MGVTYAIVKVYVTERNDDIKRYSNVIIIWGTSEIVENIYVRKWKVCKKKNLRVLWVLGVDRKIRPSRSQFGIRDPRYECFYLPLTPMKDPYTPL